ncbi:MAG TPA: DEAD/DEAH box helicase family protein, partial [Bryobacteraceae bacterium]|nr:DEAD/DEAH box helicase family protein [Bryobacteraceae bacterium]
MGTSDRPKFKAVKSTTTYATPEALFYKLSERDKSHGYLRGPQQDVLREYAETFTEVSDIAFELPTGTGKTAVGMLIAEWWRLQSRKVAFLSLTNQLAGQVLEEAKRLRVSTADVRGDKERRDKSEEGRYRTGEATAVTTYSNLFNINPVIRESDVIIFDDAHGAEQYVSDMWSVSVSSSKQKALFGTLIAALRPGFTDAQTRSLLSRSAMGSVEMPDIHGHPDCLTKVVAALDESTMDSVKFSWRLIRNHIESCVFLASAHGITIRPLLPPTHTHEAFERAKQRIYMSATLGGGSDLQRSYGIEKIAIIRAQSPQWGRRYVFVPGVHTTSERADEIASGVWNELDTRRALLLAPSDRQMEARVARLKTNMKPAPSVIGAQDIAETLDGFTGKTDVLLALAGRYDGLDLPDDQCRFLILSESPKAINSLERHLSERWKMGPVLRTRERTRLTQGMGRCTRSATDFAVIIWLGQSLVDLATSNVLLEGLPPELKAEISWGVTQSEAAAKNPGELVQMMLGLIHDPEYRKGADDSLRQISAQKTAAPASAFDTAGQNEVRFAKALWDDNFTYAHELAHKIADQMNAPELAGYRAWWWFLASRAAFLMRNKAAEQDCLRRGASCGVNGGWLNSMLHR